MKRSIGGLRRRRPVLIVGIAVDAVLMSLLIAGIGAIPASALTPPGQVWNTTTQTAWIPLECNLNGNLITGIPLHIGVALTATFPTTVTPGQKFAITKVTAFQVQPGAAQFAANSFNADQVAGTVTDFEQKLTGATGGFLAPNNGALINQVQALQPANIDAPSPVDPLVDPDSSNAAPGAWWAAQTPPIATSDAKRHNLFSFGGIPIDTSSSLVPTSYGPSPGTGGGHNPNLALDGTPDPINVYPFNVTGAAGTNLVMDVGDTSRMVHLSDGSADGPLVAISGVFFHSVSLGVWETTPNGVGFPTVCGKDTNPGKVPKPDPAYVDQFTIPIVAAPGLLRVTSSPPLPTQISVDGNIADTWGLTWMEIAAGSHTVCFTHVEGYTEPSCQTVIVNSGAATTVTGTFVQRGFLHVFTNPTVAGQISVDGNPTDNWGMFTDIPAGPHNICFGPVANFLPPPCQNGVVVTAGATTNVTGNYTSSPGAPGNTGVGFLRAVTSPPLPSQISIKAAAGSPYVAETWGLTWLELPAGSYTVSFSHVQGYTEPAPQMITVSNGVTTTVTGTFTQRGFLHVFTSPSQPATVYVNDIPRDDWGMFTDIPTGSYTVCFGPTPAFASAPPCQTAVVSAGATTNVTGTYPF